MIKRFIQQANNGNKFNYNLKYIDFISNLESIATVMNNGDQHKMNIKIIINCILIRFTISFNEL